MTQINADFIIKEKKNLCHLRHLRMKNSIYKIRVHPRNPRLKNKRE